MAHVVEVIVRQSWPGNFDTSCRPNGEVRRCRRCPHVCIRATRGRFEYSLWHKLSKALLTVIN